MMISLTQEETRIKMYSRMTRLSLNTTRTTNSLISRSKTKETISISRMNLRNNSKKQRSNNKHNLMWKALTFYTRWLKR